MKRILFVMHHLAVGGAERVSLNLANGFAQHGWHVRFALFDSSGDLTSKLVPGVARHNLECKRVAFGGMKLFRLIKAGDYDVVFTSITHVNCLVGLLIPLCRVFCTRTIFVNREVNMPTIRAKTLSSSRRLDKLYRYVIHNFDLTIAQSEYMKSDIIHYYNRKTESVVTVENPIASESIIVHSTEDVDLPGEAWSSGLKLLAVGGLRRQKGIARMLEILSRSRENYSLVVAGEGPERATLENLAIRLGISNKVFFMGLVDNPYKWMKSADALLVTSEYEGFPNTVLESSICGTPILALESPGVDSAVVVSGVNGFLAKSEEDFLSFLNESTLQKLSTDCMTGFGKQFDIATIIGKYEALFEELAS